MKITNLHNIPAAFYERICNDEYKRSGRYSVSQMPQPPQVTLLVQRHYDEIVKDASDFLWLFLGKAVHEYLSKYDTANAIKEEELVVDIDGVTVSGRTDIYSEDVADYKVTSVFAIKDGLKDEWLAQTNLYAMFWQKHGFTVNNLYIHAILRDWQRSKSLEHDYPKIPFQTIAVPNWGVEKTEHYLRNRLGIYLLAEKLSDNQMPPCTPKEQWMKPTVFAVMKKGQKSAVRHGLKATMEEAEAMAAETKGGYVQERIGVRTRCESYCDAKPFCHQYKAEHPAATAAEFGFEEEE